MEALPRASLLTYFRPTSSRRARRTSRYYRRPPPPYSAHSTRSSLLPSIPEVDPERFAYADEEARLGSFQESKSNSEYDSDEDEDNDEEQIGTSCGLFEVICFIWIVLTILVWAWSMAVLVKYDHFKATEVQFCLIDDNRDAPLPRAWRYMASNSEKDCTTQIVSLNAPKNGWRLYPDDTILFGDDRSYLPQEESDKKFIDVQLDGPEAEENNVGDDRA
ncbi:unnamed protein product [Periconia digitata]|uniref:Uncharacterized protein n=1 Tax=Periconia digitata TaxID=1303443 RepID=A0A9W4XIL3_9PLEO|nr:unnamed protein product [Periconia digitata]